ncbi:PREDICTED: E3 ubiquitin-protein ligase Topors-like, partial [Calidris pugnax]|uniref:E3 ubiquitin-protein ligase Topors-like n=1 Tax=Calidris pugnax TaxID=198806 RepID=UPI00071C2D3A
PEVWAQLFRQDKRLLNPVLPWLRQRLEAIFGEQWWLATGREALLLQALCLWGLDEEAMVEQLQPGLEEHTASLVHDLIDVVMRRCSHEALRMLQSFTAGQEEEEDGHAANSNSTTSSTSSSSPEDSDVEEHPSTLEAALQRGPSRPRSVPVPVEQEQPQEEPEEAVAGPSAQGRSSRPSAPSR